MNVQNEPETTPDLSLRAKRSNLQDTLAVNGGDCFVAPLLAMTPLNGYDAQVQRICQLRCTLRSVAYRHRANDDALLGGGRPIAPFHLLAATWRSP